MQTELILIGGFLGAGKTTFMRELSRCFTKKGKKVGLITNDQASALVDTALLSEENDHVVEVSGSCFCCNFKGFADAVTSLRASGVDTIIAEPVGSCTDLSATIMQPVKEKCASEFRLYPLSVLIDPQRLSEILGDAPATLHPSAAYIVTKQLEEADLIVINKSDLLSEADMKELVEKTRAKFPDKPVTVVSALTGAGIEDWLDTVSSMAAAGKTITNVDYDVYAEGEAVLGWLNMAVELEKPGEDWDAFASCLLNTLGEKFDKAGLSVAHVKIRLETGGKSMLGNITGSKDTAQVRDCAGKGDKANLTINARVETSPENLLDMVESSLQQICAAEGIRYCIAASNCLQPGRPEPTFRYDKVVA